MKKHLITLIGTISLLITSSVFCKVSITNKTPYQSTIKSKWMGEVVAPFPLSPGKTDVRGRNSLLNELSAVITVPGQGDIVTGVFKNSPLKQDNELIIVQDANNKFTVKSIK